MIQKLIIKLPTSLSSASSTSNSHKLKYIYNPIEDRLRKSILSSDFNKTKSMLYTLNNTMLSNGRNVIYIITETCRKSNQHAQILQILSSIRTDINCKEDDVMPLINECVDKNDMSLAQDVVSFLMEKQIKLSAKLFSLLLKGTVSMQFTHLCCTSTIILHM
jgi:hypothetical protein